MKSHLKLIVFQIDKIHAYTDEHHKNIQFHQLKFKNIHQKFTPFAVLIGMENPMLEYTLKMFQKKEEKGFEENI